MELDLQRVGSLKALCHAPDWAQRHVGGLSVHFPFKFVSLPGEPNEVDDGHACIDRKQQDSRVKYGYSLVGMC